MPESRLTIRVDSELKDEFTSAARQQGLTYAELLRCLMRDYLVKLHNFTDSSALSRQKGEAFLQDCKEESGLPKEGPRPAQ